MLADYINLRTASEWNRKNAEDRYNTLVRKYKTTKTASEKTGFGCTEDDFDADPPIDTVEKKLESMCPYFHRLDTLYGGRQNIAPSHVFEVCHSYNFIY